MHTRLLNIRYTGIPDCRTSPIKNDQVLTKLHNDIDEYLHSGGLRDFKIYITDCHIVIDVRKEEMYRFKLMGGNDIVNAFSQCTIELPKIVPSSPVVAYSNIDIHWEVYEH